VQRRVLGIATSLLLLLLLAGACGGGSKHASANKAKATTTTAPAPGATSTTAAAGPNATGTGKGAVATPQMSTSKSAAKPASPTASNNSTSNPDTGLHAAAPGTYTYARTGTSHDSIRGDRSLNGNTSLKMDPAANGDQHSVQSSPDGSSSEQTVRFLTEGAYFTDLKQSTGGFAKEFQPNPPVLALPAQATIGRTWSWTVTSTDGKTTLNASFKVERNETLTIGGQSTPTVVLTVTLKATGDVTLDSTATDWVSLAKGLIVRTDSTSSGSIGTITFNSQSSSVLQSTKPS
jgi:hypothetical protein